VPNLSEAIAKAVMVHVINELIPDIGSNTALITERKIKQVVDKVVAGVWSSTPKTQKAKKVSDET
jgi:hypothetical protein